jgi:hypothetical protein
MSRHVFAKKTYVESLMSSVSSLILQGGAVDGLAQSEFADACLPVSRGIP